MRELSPYWGDPVPAHLPLGSEVRVSTMHEGVLLIIRRQDRTAEVFLGPDEARKIASNLGHAVRQWEED